MNAVAEEAIRRGQFLVALEVLEKLVSWGAEVSHEYAGKEENVVFSLPKELQKKADTEVSAG